MPLDIKREHVAHPDNHTANDHAEMDKGPPDHTRVADIFPPLPGPIPVSLSQCQVPAPRLGNVGPNRFYSDMTSLSFKV